MKKILFVVNRIYDFEINDLIIKHLDNIEIAVAESLPANTAEYDLIILWSYKKLIKIIPEHNNIIIFHSSDLPEGKGWAPIYNTVADGKKEYVVTAIKLATEVDSGEIIAKGRFAIKDNYTAASIREFTNELEIMIIKEILEKDSVTTMKGMTQDHSLSTYYPRRSPANSEISIDSRLSEVVNHLRACEESFPAYFYFNNAKYNIYITPEIIPGFPEDIKVEYYI